MSGATAPAGWEGILDPGERILWQGRPVPGIVWRPQQMVTFLFGLAFAGFALFWMLMAATAVKYGVRGARRPVAGRRFCARDCPPRAMPFAPVCDPRVAAGP